MVLDVSNRKTFIQVEFVLQCLHCFLVVKQRPLFDKLEETKELLFTSLLRKKCIAKKEHILFYDFFFVMNEKLM